MLVSSQITKFLTITIFIAFMGCSNDESSSEGAQLVAAPASGQQDATVTGTLSIGELPAETVAPDYSLNKREVYITDANDTPIAKTLTGTDGSFAVSVPGQIAISGGAGAALSLANTKGLFLKSVLSDTQSGSVIGLNNALDFSAGAFVNLGSTALQKITAIRGRVLLDGSKDHTGIVAYIPGTSFAARTDSSGNFLMTFLSAGTYNLRFEKDGYLPFEQAGVIVVENETTQVEPQILKLSGGTSAFTVKKVGPEGVSQSLIVDYFIDGGNADRFKAGLITEVEAMPYGAVPESFRYTFPSDGTYTLKMIFANADGFEASAIRTVVVDTVAPVATGLNLADRDSLSITHSNEKIVIGFHETCFDIDKVAVTIDNTPPAADQYIWDCHVGASDSNSNFTLPDETTQFGYHLWVMDQVGNIGVESVQGSVNFDSTPPDPPQFTLSDQTSGSSLGSDITTINLSMQSCEDIDRILISESQVLAPEPKAFSKSCSTEANYFSHTFGNNIEGEKVVLVWAIDPAGNVGQVAGTQTMVLDQTAPLLPTITVVDGSQKLTEGYANNLEVQINLSDCDDITHVLFSETQTEKPLETDPLWQGCSSEGLSFATSGEGLKTIYTWVRDVGGNVSVAKASNTITIDTTPPDASSLTFVATDPSQNNNLATNESTVNVLVSPCGAEATQVLVSEVNSKPLESAFGLNCEGGSLNTTYTFSNTTNENKSLFLWVRDQAGNVSLSAKSQGIVYDTVDPSLPGSFQVMDVDTDSVNFTNSQNLKYAIDACPSDAYLLLSESQSSAPEETDSNWAACTTSGTWSNLVSSGVGTKLVYLWIKDEAGNINASSLTDSIDWDSSAPSPPTLTTPNGTWVTEYTQSNPSTVEGTAEANASIEILDSTNSLTYQTTVDGSGDWSYSLPLDDNSTISISVTAIDEAGNVSSSASAWMAHDTIAPTVSSVSTALTDVTADISFSTPGEQTVYTLDYGTSLSYGSSVNTGSYTSSHTASLSSLAAGTTYYYRIRTTDAAGNMDTGNDHTGSFKTYNPKTGNISSNETWNDTTTSYLITGNLTIDSGVTLTINPGVDVKVASGRTITVNGKIDANGSSGSRIRFSGNTSSATQKGFWNGFYFNSTAQGLSMTGSTYNDGNRFNYVDISNAGASLGGFYMDQAGVYMNETTISYFGSSSTSKVFEFVSSPQLYLSNSTFENITGYILYAYNQSGQIDLWVVDTEFKNATREAIYLYNSYTTGSLEIDGLNTIGVSDDSLYLRMNSSGVACSVKNSVFGPVGMVAYLRSCSLSEFSRNILLRRSSSLSWAAQLSTGGATTQFKNNVVVGSGQPGLYLSSGANGSAYEIEDNHFIDNRSYQSSQTGKAIDIGAGSGSMTIRNNLFLNNTGYSSDGKGVISIGGTRAVTISQNNFFGNTSQYLLYNEQANTEADWTATNNFWNTTDSGAIADMIYDSDDLVTLGTVVATSPLASWDTSAPVSQVQNVSGSSNGGGSITLNWDANPESDISGYKIYYDNDSSSYPFEGSGAIEGGSGIVLGDVQTATITGLNTSQTYYFTVTAIDSSYDGSTDILDGNESWHSDAVSIFVSP